MADLGALGLVCCLSVEDQQGDVLIGTGFGAGLCPVPLQGNQSPPTALLRSTWGTRGCADVADLVRVLMEHVCCGQGELIGATGVSL